MGHYLSKCLSSKVFVNFSGRPRSIDDMSKENSYSHQSSLEVSESAFEYLLGELLLMKPKLYNDESLNTPADKEFALSQRLDEAGFHVGSRFVHNAKKELRIFTIISQID